MTSTVAFFDVAGTLVSGNPWKHMLAHPDIDASRKRLLYAQILPTWLGRKAHFLSDTTFRNQWIRQMAALFNGWKQTRTQALFEWVVNEELGKAYHQEVLAQLQHHRERGDHIVLVSGIFHDFVTTFARKVGADAGIGSALAYRNGVCQGEIAGQTCVGPRKLDFIREYLKTHGFSTDLAEHYGYADSFSDTPLLSAVGHAVATYPDTKLRTIAQERGWAIIPG